MKKTTILAATIAALFSATSASALSYLSNFGVGDPSIEEGTERVTEDSTTDTTKGNGKGAGKGKSK